MKLSEVIEKIPDIQCYDLEDRNKVVSILEQSLFKSQGSHCDDEGLIVHVCNKREYFFSNTTCEPHYLIISASDFIASNS